MQTARQTVVADEPVLRTASMKDTGQAIPEIFCPGPAVGFILSSSEGQQVAEADYNGVDRTWFG